MMLDVHLLGTGGMMPLPNRHLTALLVRCRGEAILIDCGEGTQVALHEAGLGFKQIGVILLTHFHADHIAGLPGLLLTIGNSGRTEPVTVIGPQFVKAFTECLCVIAQQLPFALNFIEVEDGKEVFRLGNLSITAKAVEHRMPCFAYRIDLSRNPRFCPEAAEELGVPKPMWSALQSGRPVVIEGRIILPSAVSGVQRKGISLCYATDLRPSNALAEFVQSVDLFVCEGIYGDPALREKALHYKHCMFNEAAAMAKRAGVKALWLTHFSPSMPDPAAWLEQATEIFPNTRVDGSYITLHYPEE